MKRSTGIKVMLVAGIGTMLFVGQLPVRADDAPGLTPAQKTALQQNVQNAINNAKNSSFDGNGQSVCH